MRRILSYLVLLMLFATSGYASIPLTTAHWTGNSTCEYVLFKSTDTAFGLQSPNGSNYADLSNFSKLVLTVPEGQPRVFFNATGGGEDQRLTVGPGVGTYMTKSGNTYTIDIEKILADKGSAKLNSIKAASYNVELTVTSMQLVEKVSVSNTIYFSDVSIGGEGGKQSNFRNNILSVTPHNLNEPTSFKFVLKDANGENTITTPVDPSNFRISSSDANVIDVSSASVSQMSSGNYKYEITGVKLNPGTAYLTVRYGNVTETHPINIAKIPVYIRGKGSNAYTKHANDGAWWVNFYVSPIGSTETLNFDSKDYFSQSAFKLWSGAVTYNWDGYTSPNQYDVRITPAHTGTEIIIIKLRNHPLYEDCDAEFPLTILKNKQVISYPGDWSCTYDQANSWGLRNDVENNLNERSHNNINTSGSPWTYIPSGKPITFKSSDTNVLNVNANTGKITWTGNAGTATITATVAGDDNWAEAEASFTLTVNGTVAGPRLIWLTYYNTYTSNMVNTGRGSSYGWYWFKTREEQELDLDGHTVTVSYTNEKNNVVPYNQDQWFQAIALRSDVTDEELKAAGFKEYPYKNNMHDYWYYIAPDGGPRYFNNPIAPFLYGTGTPDERNRTHNSKIVYTIDVPLTPDGMRWVTTVQQNEPANTTGNQYVVNYDDGSAHWYGSTDNQSNYGALLHVGSTFSDSLTVTATYPGNGNMNPSTTYNKFWVQSSTFGFSFQPDEGVVNKDHWIIPYVKFPDLKLIDFKNIWVTIDNEVAVSVEGADDMYSLANVKNPSTGQPYGVGHEADAVAAIQACTSEATLKTMLGGYFDYFKLKHDETLGWMIEGIYPKIWGLTVGEEADVTIHIEGYGGTFADAEATYHVKVVGEGDDLFHWEMNNNMAGQDDKVIKTIYMIEGDYIYMPGIVGNPNGNDDYSKEGSYKYLYGIQENNIIMNFKPYFWREGIANYFFTYNYQNDTQSYSGKKPSTDRLIPTTNTSKTNAPEALIFWASGLGDYYRNDSLLIYANKPTNDNQHLYLWAEDPQTGLCCTPIEIKIYSRNSLLAERQESLANMTYPFTWDFKHMNLCGLEEIKRDAKNGTYYGTNGHSNPGNGGTYWRKRWDSSGGSTLRSPHGIDKDYYQYNGVFNADYDDKDNNYSSYGYDPDGNRVSGSRQRWFKDLSANGTYLHMFKGLRLNIAGLDYWEQKYTRFNVSTKSYGGIFFEGGVHYLSLPGFGINGSAVIFDATREKGSLPMPGSQVHFNTDENNCTVDYFNRGYVPGSENYWHNPVFENYANKKNNKVYFVIKAKGNSNRSIIYVGGKSMMLSTNTNSRANGIGTGTDIGENGTLYSTTNEVDNNNLGTPTKSQRILLSDAVDKPKIYAIPLDPWDDDFQEQIYLAFNNGVHVYWMGITTEPRYLRDDYETYTYSYPVDLDIDRTNQVMDILTEERFGEGNTVNMVPYYGTGYQHASKSLVVDRLLSDETETRAAGDKALESEELVDYKIPANEGIVLYPTTRLHAIKEAIGDAAYEAGTEKGTVPGKTVISVLYDENNKPVTDNTGKILYKSTQYDYEYRYLPTYFIANAQNMDKENYANNVAGRGVGKTINDANIKPNGQLDVPALTTKDFQYTDGMERTGVYTYNLPNRLTASSYSTYIFKDYYSKDGQMPTGSDNGVSHKDNADYHHFIALGMTNEYNKRYLDYNEDYDVYKELKDYMHDAQGNQLTPGNPDNTPNDPTTGEFDHVDTQQFYYNLIGPAAVKFYRAGNDNWARGRRSYMKLTWEEYEVNTIGKIIYSSDGASPGEEYYEYVPETQNGPNSGDIAAGGPQPSETRSNYTGVKLIFKTNGGNNTNEEELVSEDGGFPDGIEEVKQDTGNGAFYNLNGTLVTTPRKGVYIHNGKKVIIK